MAASLPMTNSAVESASHNLPSVPTTVADLRPFSTGAPVRGSRMCPYTAPSAAVKKRS